MLQKKSVHKKKKSRASAAKGNLRLLRNCFIPHAGNDHAPHALRPKALVWYGVILFLVKAVSSLVLFLSYPEIAQNQIDARKEFVTMANAARESQHLRPLIVNDELMRAAQAKADDMLARGYFDHYTPEGAHPGSFIHQSVYRYRGLGENLALDFAAAEPAHTAFMASPSHRANILHPRFVHVGVGISSGIYQGRITNIAVELFASPDSGSRVLGASTSSLLAMSIFSLSSWRSSFQIWVKRVYLAAMVYLSLSLLLAIIIRARVQHVSVIVHVLALIAVITLLAFTEIPSGGSAGIMVQILSYRNFNA